MINLSNIGLFLSDLEKFIGAKNAILICASLSFFIKLYIITKLLSNTFKHRRTHTSLSLLIIYICTSMIADFAWMIKLIRELFLPAMDYRLVLFWIRIAWAFNVIQAHSLALFIESLIKSKKLIGLRQKLYIPITIIISSLFFLIAITYLTILHALQKFPF